MKFAIVIAAIAFATASPAAEESAGPAKPSVFKGVLKEKLVALRNNRLVIHEIEEEPRLYAFYFSAHWCPPCRAFTPALVEFYNEHPGKGRDFEIIFVSDDEDARSMERYMKEAAMPWPAVGHRLGANLREIRKYRGRGIPCLVVVDHQGRVLSDSVVKGQYVGPMKVMNDLAKLTAPGTP